MDSLSGGEMPAATSVVEKGMNVGSDEVSGTVRMFR